MERRYRRPLMTLVIVIGLLLCLHLALPWLVRDYLNHRLADMGDYRGHIENVDLAWWRGAYRLEGVTIVKTGDRVPAPLLDAPAIDLAVSWRALWEDQALVARVRFEQPRVTFVDGGDRGATQTGAGTDWRAWLQQLMPITLNEVVVRDGRLDFRNFHSEPEVHLRITALNARVTNLTNTASAASGSRVARFNADAKVLGQADLQSSAAFDPLGDLHDFDFRLKVTGMVLSRLNDFARAYANLDIAQGSGDLIIEASARDGRLDGYIKPLLKNVDVFTWKQDVARSDGSLFSAAWEALVDGVETLFKNQRKDQFATRIPLSGSVESSETSTWRAFLGILRNAFVEAFSARFENGDSDQ